MIYHDKIFSGPQDIVNVFGEFFKSVYQPSYGISINNANVLHNNHIHLYPVSDKEIGEAIKELKDKMTAGVDKIPSFLIKDCSAAFVKPSMIIFN